MCKIFPCKTTRLNFEARNFKKYTLHKLAELIFIDDKIDIISYNCQKLQSINLCLFVSDDELSSYITSSLVLFMVYQMSYSLNDLAMKSNLILSQDLFTDV